MTSFRATSRGTLYWRLLLSYLVLLSVGAATAFLVAEAVAPFFFQRHIAAMEVALAHVENIDLGSMASDLVTSYRDTVTQSLLWAIFVGAAAAGGVSLFVTQRIVLPLRAMTRASRQIAGGHYSRRLDTRAPGEIGDLAEAFNVMASTLESSEERRVILLADVAHEFRTPLSNLQGYLEGLEDGVFVPADVVVPAMRQVARLERLTSDLSILSKVETGQLTLDRKPVAARDLLDRTAIAFRKRATDGGVTLEVAMSSKPVWVSADVERTSQVLDNLVSNALRYTPVGARVTLACTGRQEGSICFEVADTGAGIAAEHLPHIFHRFYRVDAARGRNEGGGSGIGLTLVKQLVERMGGSVDVRSEVGRGTTFGFTLPEAKAPTSKASTELAVRPAVRA